MISIIGGFPDEKKRSLIFGALLSIAVRSAETESGATADARAGAGAVPAGEMDGSTSLTVALVMVAFVGGYRWIVAGKKKVRKGNERTAVTEVTQIVPKWNT
ncbi:MAG: hypothetical protein ACM3WP_12455 [Acidobacteriota bacterium]